MAGPFRTSQVSKGGICGVLKPTEDGVGARQILLGVEDVRMLWWVKGLESLEDPASQLQGFVVALETGVDGRKVLLGLED